MARKCDQCGCGGGMKRPYSVRAISLDIHRANMTLGTYSTLERARKAKERLAERWSAARGWKLVVLYRGKICPDCQHKNAEVD